MNYAPGDILKRRNPVPGNQDIGVVVDANQWHDDVEVLLFDADGPYTRIFNRLHADDLFELDDGR